MTRSRIEFAAALLLEIVGAGGALLLSTRHWQTITTARPRPFATDVLRVSGRTIDSAPTALALVALAGVVAVLATKGLPRRVIGALVAAAGVVLAVRSALAVAAVSAERARSLVADKHPRAAGSELLGQHVATDPIWGVLSVIGGGLVLAAGLLICLRGARWAAMSARYDAPVATAAPDDPERARAKADARLWSALERGEDPTAEDPRAPD